MPLPVSATAPRDTSLLLYAVAVHATAPVRPDTMASNVSTGELVVWLVPSGNWKNGNRSVRSTIRPLPNASMLSSTTTVMYAVPSL